ncbi:MAG: Sphingosine kinase and enzyme eukaryotic diacylglycerol kinase, partial [Candidatus Peregrinibacteria bacterium GW2011_GWA2_47_7]
MYISSTKRLLGIINPVCGVSVPWDYRKLLSAQCEKEGYRVTFVETTKDGDDYLRGLDYSHFDRVVVIGGDGTVREVLSFFLRSGIDVSVGIVPAGTG